MCTTYILYSWIYQVYSGHCLGPAFFESDLTTCKFLKPIVSLMAKHPYIALKGLNPGWNSEMDSVPQVKDLYRPDSYISWYSYDKYVGNSSLRNIYVRVTYSTHNIFLCISIYIDIQPHNVIQDPKSQQIWFDEWFFRRRNLNMDALLCWGLWVSWSGNATSCAEFFGL